MKLSPVAKAVPPVAAAYQLIVPVLDVAAKVAVPSPQIAAGVVLAIVGGSQSVVKVAAEGQILVSPEPQFALT